MRKLIGLTMLVAFVCMASFGQRTVTGTVKGSDTKELLPQVNVIIKGTTIGAVTDFDGYYSIKVPEGRDTLVFKYVGYEEKEVAIGSGANPTIDVMLEPTEIDINTVVVSASRKEEKILDAPASVTVINAEKIENEPTVTVIDHVQYTPGVDVMKTGLASSNVVVRGFNNIFSTALLNIVDNRIARIPSLRVNAYQLIPTSNYDIERMEIVRGPGSALYGPNAADGVLAIFTKSPLDQDHKFITTLALNGGLRAKGADPVGGTSYDAGLPLYKRGVVGGEFRHSAKLNNKIGYKVSGSYTEGYDWRYYDPREPAVGDTLIFGNVENGRVFQPDTTVDPKPFDRDFLLRRANADARVDFRPNDDLEIILSGGFSMANGIELTGLGAGQAGNWVYYNGQARLRWKELYFNYFVNSSNANDTYLIPQVQGAEPPHDVQFLVDKSKLHVAQIQHSIEPLENKLSFIYGVDGLFTIPKTGGTINGRFEDEDNVIQIGGYLQGEWDIITKLTLVGALRVDWHNEVAGAFVSPRAALVYKPTSRHTLRATYNRAFSSPSTLNLSLDLSNGIIPNGINIRGIGNPNGYNYRYDDTGNPMFISPATQNWYSLGDMSDNHVFFDDMTSIIARNLAANSSLVSEDAAIEMLQDLTAGITSDTGTIQNVSQIPIDYVKFLNSGDFTSSVFGSLDGFNDVDPIDNQITQSWEIGYKGILFDKLFVTADFYYTKISNYVSPLTLKTASVMFNPQEVVGALGAPQPGGLLYDNLRKQSTVFPALTHDELLTPLLDSAYIDPSGNIPYMPGTVWDELAVILSGASSQIPIGSVTPDDDKVQSDIILTYVNLGTIDVGGMDLSARLAVTDEVNLSMAYSYVTKDSIPLEGAQGGYVALNAPMHKTATAIEYSSKKTGLTARMAYRWQAGFPANSAVYVGHVKPAHYLDLGLAYKLPFSKNTVVSLDISNVTNNKHRPFPGTPKMGTFALLKIAHTFKSKK